MAKRYIVVSKTDYGMGPYYGIHDTQAANHARYPEAFHSPSYRDHKTAQRKCDAANKEQQS